MAMIFVNRDRQSLGQFTEEEISSGLGSGRFLPSDLAWKEGMESWQPLSSFAGLVPPSAVSVTPVPPPVLQSGPAPALHPGKIDFNECFSAAWKCFQANWLMCVLGTLIFYAITMVVQIPMQFAQVVFENFTRHGSSPQIGIIIAISVVFLFFTLVGTGVSSILSAGFLFFFIEALRTGKANIEHVFAGFRRSNWVQILLAMVVWMAAVFVIILVMATVGILLNFVLASLMKSNVAKDVILILSIVIACIPIFYLSPAIIFVFPLIVDKHLGFREAITTSLKIVHRQWFQTFGLLILVALITMIGLFACCVGILASLPFAYLIWGQGYRQLFGDVKPQA